MEIETIEKLARLMKENDLDVLEMSEGDSSIKLKRHTGPDAMSLGLLGEAPQRLSGPFTPAAADGTETPVAASKGERGTMVISPTVGVFYAAPSPDSKPFVEVGDKVKKGDTLCIIEAMKLMNEIPAELDGTIAEICVSNGQVVEYNQPLFRIISDER